MPNPPLLGRFSTIRDNVLPKITRRLNLAMQKYSGKQSWCRDITKILCDHLVLVAGREKFVAALGDGRHLINFQAPARRAWPKGHCPLWHRPYKGRCPYCNNLRATSVVALRRATTAVRANVTATSQQRHSNVTATLRSVAPTSRQRRSSRQRRGIVRPPYP